MTLEQHGDGFVFDGSVADRKVKPEPAATARRRQTDIGDLASRDATDISRLARQLRQEWRRERHSRLLSDQH